MYRTSENQIIVTCVDYPKARKDRSRCVHIGLILPKSLRKARRGSSAQRWSLVPPASLQIEKILVSKKVGHNVGMLTGVDAKPE